MTSEEAAALTALSTGIGKTLILIAEELRHLNDRGDRLNEALLEFFEKLTAKDDEGSPVGSGQPAAAPDGQEGGGL